MSGGGSPLTTTRRLGPGGVQRTGPAAAYRSLALIEGEPHLVRTEFGACGAQSRAPRRLLLSLAHLTDLQLADVQSPVRFEFLNRQFADPRYAEIVPVQRPQEALTAHAVDAMLRTVNTAHGPAIGAPPELVVTTGDSIDNAQWNEVQAFLALFDGGQVAMNSGGPGYYGVQSVDWPDDIFWKPDGVAASGPDLFRAAFGFPHYPGLLSRALAEFSAPGLQLPWLSCFGNHEALSQGVGVVTAQLAAALVGDSKPWRQPDDFDHDRALEIFTHFPEAFLAGPSRPVVADPDRRPVSRQEFVAAHFRAGARPAGHGFTDRNRRDGTAYYVYDTPSVRLIALDTNCLAGGAAGCLDHDQAQWLEGQLAAVHSAYQAPDGSEICTSGEDRLVVVFSHHGVDSLIHPLVGHSGPDGQPLLGADGIVNLLHRFPNVVLWLNGHTHLNAVRPRQRQGNANRGFWEVTTSSIVDWPCQARLVELVESAGELSIFCTMIDHDSPLGPRSLESGRDLAALHRELAANMPFAGLESARPGTHADRNVELRMAAPFPLAQLRPR
ncbi:MAG TPA: TIGR03767 family metallophosphoesterase [Streptosporangiaceae bacterium]|nr:TIGR03767 family metallophosphoesterase [Streptosporangiaceae bacterium]